MKSSAPPALVSARPRQSPAVDLLLAITAAALVLAFGLLPSSCVWGADPLDWPYWRGANFDSTSPETGLVDDFDPKGGDGSNVLWKRDDMGTRSTPIVMNGKLYVLARADAGTDREGERVVCLDAATGETLWENRFNVWLSDVPDTRVAWSSVVGDPETGNVYALGVCGYFQCLDGNTGKTIWSNPMHEFFGMITTYGGRTNFPVIADDLVIVGGVMTNWGEMAKPAHRLVAFDKRTGEMVWFNGTAIGPSRHELQFAHGGGAGGPVVVGLWFWGRQSVVVSAAHRPAHLALRDIAPRFELLATGSRRHGVHGAQ